MILYHLAEKENLDNILKNGLVPGDNSPKSKFVSEVRPCIYLCPEEYIQEWAILLQLNDPVVLRVNGDNDHNIKNRNSLLSSEYVTKYPIAPENISPTAIKINIDRDAMIDTISDCTYMLNSLSVVLCRCCWAETNKMEDSPYYEQYHNEAYRDYVNETVKALKTIFDECLDFSMLEKGDVEQIMLDAAYESCQCTVFDTFLETEKKVHQILHEMDEPTFESARKIIWNIIDDFYMAECADIDTGDITDL